MPGVFTSLHRERVGISGAAFYLRLSGIARSGGFQVEVQLNRRGFGAPSRMRWVAVAVAVAVAFLFGPSSAGLARHYLHGHGAAEALPRLTIVPPRPPPPL